MQTRWLGPLFILLLALAGCGQRDVPVREDRPPPFVLMEIPQTRQATPYTCGVAVVQSILAHNGFDYRQDVLEKKVGATEEDGTGPQAIIACLEEHGIGAAVARDMTLDQLRGHIDSGRPVICFLQAWNDDPAFDYSTGWDDGHYAVAIGYDAGRIYFMDPSTLANYTYIDNEEFLTRWHDGDATHRIHQAGIVVTNARSAYRKNAFLPML